MSSAAKSKSRRSGGTSPGATRANPVADLILQHRAILAGAEFSELEALRDQLDLSMAEMAEVVLISQRTLNRRRKEGRLEPDESDRVLRLQRLFSQASELFDGEQDKARDWFQTEFRDLGDESPLSLARTDAGAREVEHFIGRLEHDVFV